MLRNCDLCDKPFVADADWKTLCVICWKEEKGYKLGVGDTAFQLLQQEFIDTKAAMDALKKASDHYRKLAKKLKKKNKQEEEEEWLTQKEIMQLIRLVHPDKHNNSEVATTLTKKLLSLRDKS